MAAKIGALAVAICCIVASTAQAETIVGVVDRAKDGDDLIVCLETTCIQVRLCGIDAPERGSKRLNAKIGLHRLSAGRDVRCVVVGSGTPCDGRSKPRIGNRVVAQCFIGDADLAGEMVRAGLACAWAKYSGDHYMRTVPGAVSCD